MQPSWPTTNCVAPPGRSLRALQVLAGGLHDNCRAVVAGATSFGKGKIQAVFGLANGEGLTMTVAQYVTPRGTVIQSKGITPDLPLRYVSPLPSPVRRYEGRCAHTLPSARMCCPIPPPSHSCGHTICVGVSTMNPYVALLTGPALNKVDLDKINYP